MKKYVNLILIGVLFVVLILGTTFLYNRLTKEYKAENETITEGAKEEEKDEGEEVPSSEEQQPERQAALDFTVYNTEGEEVALSSFFGKPLIVNFWASWCPPCKKEFPDFQAAYDTYGEKIDFLMVNMTDGARETVEKAKTFMEENEYTLPLYLDSDQNAAITYQVYSLPTTFFIDAEGNIAAYAQGMLDAESLANGIEMILENE